MTVARSRLVDPSLTRWYHCISPCVRQAWLLGQGDLDRKGWIEGRLKELAEVFAISVSWFAILDNHLHLLLRLDPERAEGWTDEEVVRRWARLLSPRDKKRQPLAALDAWVQERLKDPAWVARTRERLVSLGWFMKCLKEPLARMCNREENARGAFFEGRYKSIALLDEEALLAVCAYIDLNPVAAGISQTPEASPHTSIQQRVAHVQAAGREQDLVAAAENLTRNPPAVNAPTPKTKKLLGKTAIH